MRVPRTFLIAIAAVGTVVTCRAAGPDDASSKALLEAILKARKDVETSTAELANLQDAVSAERAPLAKKVETLQSEVKKLREAAADARRSRVAGEEERRALRTKVGSLEEECRFAHSLLSEYRRSVETRAGRAENQLLAESLAAVDGALGGDDKYQRLAAGFEHILKLAGEWHVNRLGGMTFDGSALDEKGVECRGRFAVFGPVTYFSCEDGKPAGIAVTRLGSSLVSVFTDMDESAREGVRAVVSGRAATVPVDLTSGDALKIASAKSSLIDHLKKGGVPMAIGIAPTKFPSIF